MPSGCACSLNATASLTKLVHRFGALIHRCVGDLWVIASETSCATQGTGAAFLYRSSGCANGWYERASETPDNPMFSFRRYHCRMNVPAGRSCLPDGRTALPARVGDAKVARAAGRGRQERSRNRRADGDGDGDDQRVILPVIPAPPDGTGRRAGSLAGPRLAAAGRGLRQMAGRAGHHRSAEASNGGGRRRRRAQVETGRVRCDEHHDAKHPPVPRSGRSAGITATARFPMTGHGPQGQCHGIGFARQRPAGENGAGREAGPICHPPPATGQSVAPRNLPTSPAGRAPRRRGTRRYGR